MANIFGLSINISWVPFLDGESLFLPFCGTKIEQSRMDQLNVLFIFMALNFNHIAHKFC